ncbi:Protein of unknown function [Gryllus bimaculatus]|nr:Protein of unknown function [Gryllus bimaculatus]
MERQGQQEIQREFENIVKVEEISSTTGSKCLQCKKLAKIALREKRRADTSEAQNEEIQAINERLQLEIRDIQNGMENLQKQNNELTLKNEGLADDVKRISSSLTFTTKKLNQSRAEFSRLNQKILLLKYELSQAKKPDSDAEIVEVTHHGSPPNHQRAKAAQSLLQCPECFKTFKRACGLGSHRRIHRK